MNSLYMITKESGRIFQGESQYFMLEENDEKAVESFVRFLRSDLDEIDGMSYRIEKGDVNGGYITTIITTYLTQEYSDIIAGIELNDFYHIYNLGVPQTGTIYPELGE